MFETHDGVANGPNRRVEFNFWCEEENRPLGVEAGRRSRSKSDVRYSPPSIQRGTAGIGQLQPITWPVLDRDLTSPVPRQHRA